MIGSGGFGISRCLRICKTASSSFLGNPASESYSGNAMVDEINEVRVRVTRVVKETI